MTFTPEEKTNIRKFCGYGVFGNTPEYPFGIRYFTFSGDLEFKMNHLQDTEEAVVRDYLTTLEKLEDDIPLTADNLDTDRAAVWYHNKKELLDRSNLFDYFRKKLANFFQVPIFNANDSQPRLIV